MTRRTLPKQLKKYEHKWVALREPTNEVVGSGKDAAQAKRDAERRGYKDVILFKVLPFGGSYVPNA